MRRILAHVDCPEHDSDLNPGEPGCFRLLRWLPSDPARLLAGVDESGAIDPALYAKIKTDLGLDRPLIVQYASLAGRGRARAIGENPT